MHKELLTLFKGVTFRVSPDGARIEPKHVDVFNTEIATLGYTFAAPCLVQLRAMERLDFAVLRQRVIDHLVEITGAGNRHQTLFARYPGQVPDQHSYLLARVIGYMQDALNYEPKDFQILSCGHVIDLNLFDLREFGACPICQQQVSQIPWTRNRGNLPFERITPLKTLVYCDDAALSDLGSGLLARRASLSPAEKAFLRAVAGRVELRLPETVFKETLPFLYALLGRDAVVPHLSGATDVLRILVHVSDPDDGDLSLAARTKLKLSTRHVKDAMTMLEGLPRIAEDLLRHRGRWKVFARQSHVSKAAFRRRFPRTTTAFARLLGDEKAIRTFGSRVEPLIRARDVPAAATALKERPGMFLRTIDFLLRNCASAAQVDLVLGALVAVLPDAQTKMLFEVKKYLEHRDRAVGQRVFIPKGQMIRAQIVADERAGIPDDVLLRTIDLIGTEIETRLRRLEPLGKVYIDPALGKVVIPYNRRGDSTTSVAWPKGSRFPISEKAEVLRLFVHWTGMIDVDLSAVALSEHFETLQQVSWTNLGDQGMHHSGDIQRAPLGASEFIDARISELGKGAESRAARYLAISVLSWTGETFDTFPCFAGFMERDGLDSGEVYEPQALALKFDLRGKTRSYIPLIFDIREREVVFVDLATGGQPHQRVVAQGEKFQAVARMVVDLPNTKPTVLDVILAHAEARGTVVGDPGQADVVFRREQLDIEAVMAMMA